MTDTHTSWTRQLVPETELPERYQTPWRPAFVAQAQQHCRPGITILDVGGGGSPTLHPGARPARSTYIGLDPNADDLATGDYDLRLPAGASDLQPELLGSVDLILSWNVLEHVPDLPNAVARFRSYLKPGGVLLARFAGRWAFFAVASRAMPHALRVRLLARLIGASPDDHFPTHYDHCTAQALHRMLADWSEHEIISHYRAAGYLAFSRSLQRMYLAYETVAVRYPALATHYNVRAVR